MVFLEHRARVYYSLTTAVEAMALFVKGAIIVDHVNPPHGKKWLLCWMIVRDLRQYRCQQPPAQASFNFRRTRY